MNTDIGRLIKELRKAAGMSQTQLAEKIGVTYQQVQKYEKGISKLNIPRLMQFADAFGVSVSYLLSGSPASKIAEERSAYTGVPVEEVELLMLYRRIKSRDKRESLVNMVNNVLNLAE